MNEQLERLQVRLDQLLRVLYGTKSEKKPKTPPGIDVLGSPSDTVPPGNQNDKAPKSPSSNANGRRPLPADLRRERVVHEVPEEHEQQAKHLLPIQRKYYPRKYSKPILKRFHR